MMKFKMITTIVLLVEIITMSAKKHEALSKQVVGSSVITTNDDVFYCMLTAVLKSMCMCLANQIPSPRSWLSAQQLFIFSACSVIITNDGIACQILKTN